MSVRVVQVKEAEANNPALSRVEGIQRSAKFTQFTIHSVNSTK